MSGISVSGGDASSSSAAAGGNAGSIVIRRQSGTLNLTAGSLYAEGGYGASAFSGAGGNGGNGGSINVSAAAGLTAMFSGEGTVSAAGGSGEGTSDTSALRVGGNGGNGGSITLTAEGGPLTLPASFVSMRANGGDGGLGNLFAGNAAAGGVGGNGGSILIEALGGHTADVGSGGLSLYANGGNGGNAGLCVSPPCPPAVQGGAQGNGGSVTLGNGSGTSALTLTGNINLNISTGFNGDDSNGTQDFSNINLNISTGFNGDDSNGTQDFSTNAAAVSLNAGAGGISQTAGSSLVGPSFPVLQPPNINAVSTGTVTLTEAGNSVGVVEGQSGGAFAVSGLRGLGSIVSTNGSITLDGFAGETVHAFNPIIAGGASNALSITVDQLEIRPTGSVSGSTINLNTTLVDNYGTLKPGGTGFVGTLNASGNLTMRDGSRLMIDANGANLDTVVVAGLTFFEGPAAAPPGPGVEVNIVAVGQPPTGPHVLIPGNGVSGTVPNLTGNVVGGSLRFGSLELLVG
ncbi:MAG: hypothetical protein EOO54_30390, partial [Haliea sp.]